MIYTYLSSIRFTVLLLVLSIVFVAFGTFVESLTESHLEALAYSYETPLFFLILAGYFVNILFSACKRWPFKKRHFPFLLTHFGLLLIILGVALKQLFGVQGGMTLLEGSASSYLEIPHSHGIRLENKSDFLTFPLSKKSFSFDDAEFVVDTFLPHTKTKYKGWIHQGQAHIIGLPPIKSFKYDKGVVPLSAQAYLSSNTGAPWNIYALIVKDKESVIKTLKRDLTAKTLLILDDEKEAVSVIALNEDGLEERKEFFLDQLNEFIIFDKGYQGYGLQAHFSNIRSKEEERNEQIEHLKNKLYSLLETNLDLVPPLQRLFDASDQNRELFIESLIEFLDVWDATSQWLFYNKEQLSARTQKVCQKLLFENNLYGLLDKDKETLLSLEMRYYGLHLSTLIEPLEPSLFTLETPLIPLVMSDNEKCPLEKQLPAVRLSVKRFGKEETHILSYRSYLKTAILQGDMLLSYGPLLKKLPWHVRLLRAESKNYPGSARPMGYLAILEISDPNHLQQTQEVTLKMNQVYETLDGYRFYLSGISQEGDGVVKRVHLVVNQNPVKYWLIYPGTLCITLGASWLLWRRS